MERLRGELQVLGDKINDLEMDADEHRLVLAALAPLPANRSCWRRIGGVLVDSKVESVVPALQTQLSGIEGSLEKLRGSFKVKNEELDRLLSAAATADDK